MANKSPNNNTNFCVQNLANTTNVRQGGEVWKRRCACKTWINHWRAGLLLDFPNAKPEMYLDPPCFVRGCSERGYIGAHVVEIDGRATQYWKIVPFCAKHNHHSRVEEVYLKIGAILVPASQVDTCMNNDDWKHSLTVVKLHQGDEAT